MVGTALVVVDVVPVPVGSVVVPAAPAGGVVDVEADVPSVGVVEPPAGVVEPSVGAGVELPVGAVVPPVGSVTAEVALPLVGVVEVVEGVVAVVDGSVDVDDVCPLASGGVAAVVAPAAPPESSAAAGPAIASAATMQHRSASNAAPRDRPALVPTFSPTDTLRRPAPAPNMSIYQPTRADTTSPLPLTVPRGSL